MIHVSDKYPIYTVAHKKQPLELFTVSCQIFINVSQSCSNHSSDCICRGDVTSF